MGSNPINRSVGFFRETDPQFDYVSTLIHGDATNNKTNNTFIDSSPNNFSPTVTGTPYQGSFNPYIKNWSAYFNGSTDWLTSISTTVNNFGTGDFTVEAWIFPEIMSGTYGTVLSGTTTGSFLFNLTGGTGSLPTGVAINAFGTAPTGWQVQSFAFKSDWYHIAYSRVASVGRIFINGVQIATGADSTNYAGTQFNIASAAGGQKYTGYVSNVRIFKGGAIYTSSFTPSTTPLTTSTGISGQVSLLTLQGPNQKDNSMTSVTFSISGTPRFTRFSPFSPSLGSNSSVSGEYNTSRMGGSCFLDGASTVQFGSTAQNFITTGSTTGIQATYQAWVYPTAYNTGGNPWNFSSIVSKGAVYLNWGVRNGSLRFYWYDGTAKNFDSASTSDIPLNQWTHVMTTVSGTTITHYINGVQNAQSSTFTGVQAAGINGTDYIGFEPAGTYFTGHLSDVMVSNCIRPIPSLTEPSTADTLTRLNARFDNAGVFDTSCNANYRLIGNAKISTTQSRFGGSSMSFDGTNSIVTTNRTNELSMGAGDFTIEFWLYPNVASTQTIFSSLTTASTLDPHIYMDFANLYYYTSGANRISGAVSWTTRWYHIALSRVSGVTRLFVDGVQIGSNYTDTNSYVSPARINIAQYMGSEGTFVNSSWGNFFMDDLRITKGHGRYSSNFGIPSAPALNI
jgi:hypothetical protein